MIPDVHIVDRLRRNALKQKEYRYFVRGMGKTGSKRRADAYFLVKYAGLTHSKVATLLGVSSVRVREMIRVKTILDGTVYFDPLKFSICHPRGTCL